MLKTTVGGVISVGIWIILLAFTFVRVLRLSNRDDPSITQVDEALDTADPPMSDLQESFFKFGVTMYTE
jgi:hypothetical protein